MSLFSKALVLVTAAFISLPYALDPPNYDLELIFDDFNDIYGDPINRTCVGAIKSYAEKQKFTTGDWGYWYVYQGGTAQVQNPGAEKITKTNIATGFDQTEQCLHVLFSISDNEDYCAIASNILLETDYIDLSKMTSVSIKVKGSGFVRLYFKTKKIADNYEWGHLGYVIKLTSAWKTTDIPVTSLVPAEYSDPETDGVTWADCKNAVSAFAIEANANDSGDKENAELWVDDIVFKGMKYSDFITPVPIIHTLSRPQANPGSRFSINNNAITYTIAQPQKVSFSIVDLKGNVVSQLNSGNMTAGKHRIALPATLSAGNYLVKMEGAKGAQPVNIVK